MKLWCLIFGFAFILDFIWAEYITSVAKKAAKIASIHAVLIYLVGGISAILYMSDHWLLLPAALGSGFGTYASIKRGIK